jgi:hypothetical protein
MDRKYLLNMNLSVCLETTDLSDCLYSVVIFHNTILPKQLCSMELDYVNPSKCAFGSGCRYRKKDIVFLTMSMV